jgi:membrane-associated phospholipid phosphatase
MTEAAAPAVQSRHDVRCAGDHSRRWMLVALWAAALAAALAVDGPVARQAWHWRELVLGSEITQELKEGGHAGMTLVICVLLATLHRDKWRAVSLLVLSVVIVSVLRYPIALATARIRPIVHVDPLSFFNFRTPGFLHAKNLSFPSGHASLAFATAAALAYLLKEGRTLFFVAAALVALERVAEMAHYLSDALAAALLGMIAFKLALWVNERIWNGMWPCASRGATPVSMVPACP